MRRLVVGDIHGNLTALTSALDQAAYRSEHDRLYFVGDYIDRQPHSREVVDFILELPHTVCIRGNHDQFLVDHFDQSGPEKPIEPRWFQNGGLETLESYGIEVYEDADGQYYTTGDIPDRHLEFFHSLLPYHITPDGIPVVHGGMDLFLKRQPDEFYWWDRTMWRTAVKLEYIHSGTRTEFGKGREDENLELPFELADSYPCFDGYPKIFIGHTNLLAFPNQEVCFPQKRLNTWNLDTGAAYSGPLTIMDMDTEEYWQSETN